MDELASLHLFQPLLIGSSPVEDGGISWACWPSYRRETLAKGGDWRATFQFSADDSILERWFDNYLACHFEESYEGLTTFTGLIWSMRLAYNGVLLSKSLDNIYNDIRVRYQTGSGASATTTANTTNAASQATYGSRQLVESLGGLYIPSGTATTYRDNLLSRLAMPLVNNELVNLAGAKQPGTLQVEVRGYIHTLNGKLYNSASTATPAINSLLTTVLGSPTFVTVGSIATNATTASEEADYQPTWDMVQKIVELGSSGGSRWLAGCFQGRTFTYQQAALSTIYYEQELRTERRLTYQPGTNSLVPAALIQPGKVLFVRDIMAGRPTSSTLLHDPRAIFAESVEYTREGAVLKGSPSTEAQKAAALGIALQQRRRGGGLPT